jgi:ABC-type multidrug transport system ATPase subunit
LLPGYVEQQDIHNGMATVREALTFSAKLRLPASVTDVTREAFVDEVMGLVGLTSVQHRMIGDVSQPSLSTGQLKLLTIAVEVSEQATRRCSLFPMHRARSSLSLSVACLLFSSAM